MRNFLNRENFSISTEKNKLQVLSFLFTVIVCLRPLFFSAGDFLVYLKGSREFFDLVPIYKVEYAPFGSRFFNGPIWAIFLSPFNLFSTEVALFIFRILILITSIFLFQITIPVRESKKIVLLSLFCLWFPFRMNLNLAQGASIAALFFVLAAQILMRSKLKLTSLILSAIFITIAVNYKPSLGIFYLIYLLLIKKIRFLVTFVSLNVFLSILIYYYNPNASYINWLLLMLERNNRIQIGDYSNIIGPLALLSRIFTLSPKLVITFSLLCCLVIFLFSKLKIKSSSHFDNLVSFLGLGIVVGLYSPAQDSLVLSLLLLFYLDKIELTKVRKIIFVVISASWSLSTEQSILKSLLIGAVVSYLIKVLFKSNFLSGIHFVLSLGISILSNFVDYDHITYDLVGVGSLFSTVFVVFLMSRNDKLNL